MDSEVPHDPIQRFCEAIEGARQTEPFDPSAAALATVGPDGAPSVRFVLVKHVDARGFVFYTNGASRKGRELSANPHVALAFHWHTRGEQVRVEGSVALVSADEADRYFASRPRESQLGAWASDQSDSIADRAALEARFHKVAARFGDGPIPRPPVWGGYRIEATRIEFWKDQPGRLHDRWLYSKVGAGWAITRLQP